MVFLPFEEVAVSRAMVGFLLDCFNSLTVVSLLFEAEVVFRKMVAFFLEIL